MCVGGGGGGAAGQKSQAPWPWSVWPFLEILLSDNRRKENARSENTCGAT